MFDLYCFVVFFCMYFRYVVKYFDFLVMVCFDIFKDYVWWINLLVLCSVYGVCVVMLIEDVFVGVR